MHISSEFMGNQDGKCHAWLGGKSCCVKHSILANAVIYEFPQHTRARASICFPFQHWEWEGQSSSMSITVNRYHAGTCYLE